MRRLIGKYCISALLVAAIVLVYALVPTPDILYGLHGRFLLRAAIHPFFHGNVFHLLGCCMGAWYLFSRRKLPDNLLMLLGSYLIAFVCYGCTLRPVIGMSGMLCASFGLYAAPPTREYVWWWTNWGVILFLVITVALAFVPGVAGPTHLFCFALAYLIHNAFHHD